MEFDAIPHPWKGLSICVSHIGRRTATNYEMFIPLDSDAQTVAKVMTAAFERITAGGGARPRDGALGVGTAGRHRAVARRGADGGLVGRTQMKTSGGG